MRFSTGVLTGLLVGLAAGWWFGRLSKPALETAELAARKGMEASRENELEDALSETWLATLRLAARVNSLESLTEQLQQNNRDELLEGLFASMSDEELRGMLARTANLSPEELDDVRDIRTFAARLAEVAVEDLVEPADTEEPAGELGRVIFATRPETTIPKSIEQRFFAPSDTRIYAIFPTQGYQREAILAKWYRRDRIQILLFGRYSIAQGEAHSYVWLAPEGGWEPGEYQVDIFAADEAVTALASGRYRVR